MSADVSTYGFDGVIVSKDEFGKKSWGRETTTKTTHDHSFIDEIVRMVESDGGAVKDTPAAVKVTATPTAPAAPPQKVYKTFKAKGMIDGFYFTKEAEELELLMQLGLNTLIVGPAGCGKTEMTERVATKLGKPLIRVNLDKEFSVEDFVGMKDLRDGETVFTYGVLPTAMKSGKMLLLDEVDAAPPEILFSLQSVLEGKSLCITRNSGEIVEPCAGFGMIATANTTGRGDDTGLYTGTQILNEAFLDRWHAVISMDYLPAAAEAKVLCLRTGVETALADKIITWANLARKEVLSTIFSTVSTRKLLALCRLIVADVPPKGAFELTVTAKVTKQDASVLRELWQRIMG